MWDFDHVAEIAADGLHTRARDLAVEQAVRGLDALPETGFHPILAAAFAAKGYGAFREHPYPGVAARRPRHAERERCDLVLTPPPGLPPLDPVAIVKELDAAAGTLFEAAAPALVSTRTGTDPAEALWLEVKTVGQFCYTRGIPGPNRTYSAELLTVARSDIPKLARDPVINSAAVLLLMFAQSEEVARHDLGAFLHRCVDNGQPIASPSTAGFAVPDIIGNAWCTVAIIPVKHLEG